MPEANQQLGVLAVTTASHQTLQGPKASLPLVKQDGTAHEISLVPPMPVIARSRDL